MIGIEVFNLDGDYFEDEKLVVDVNSYRKAVKAYERYMGSKGPQIMATTITNGAAVMDNNTVLKLEKISKYRNSDYLKIMV